MNRSALLAAAVGVGAVMAMFVKPGDQPAPSSGTAAPPPAHVSAAAQAPAATPARDVQTPRESPPRVALHGVVYRGKDGASSQALLSVEGQPEQVYGIGDSVAAGWSVHAIQAQRVILSKGTELASIDVVAPAASETAATPAIQPSAPIAPRPLPGFVAGPRPATITDAPAQERNRRFLNAVQGRVGASVPPSGEHPRR
jgi:type II secretion system (T2SS) protein C